MGVLAWRRNRWRRNWVNSTESEDAEIGDEEAWPWAVDINNLTRADADHLVSVVGAGGVELVSGYPAMGIRWINDVDGVHFWQRVVAAARLRGRRVGRRRRGAIDAILEDCESWLSESGAQGPSQGAGVVRAVTRHFWVRSSMTAAEAALVADAAEGLGYRVGLLDPADWMMVIDYRWAARQRWAILRDAVRAGALSRSDQDRAITYGRLIRRWLMRTSWGARG